MKTNECPDISNSPFLAIGELAAKLSILYLATPIFLFFAFWVSAPVAILGAAGLLYTIVKQGSLSLRISKPSRQTIAIVIFCVIASSLFSLACSISPESIPFLDFAKHEAILHDLITYPWPTTYFSEGGDLTILRYSFAYYLVPALLSKIFGASYAYTFLLIWNTTGVSIFLMYAASLAKTKKFAYVAVPVIALFSGLDVLYFVYNDYSLNAFTNTVADAWSRQYSCGWLIGSNSFSLRWSPQHTIAAFLSACILHHYWDKPKFFQACAITASTLILWSPFVAISFGAISLVNCIRNRSEVKTDLVTVSSAAALVVTALCATFVLADPQGIPAGFCSGRESLISMIPEYLVFVALEFGVLAVLAWACKKKMPLIVLSSISLMCILPFIKLGAANDLQMRGSEIPICIVGFFVIQALQSRRSITALASLSIAVIIGMISGSQEALRSVKARINDFTWSTPIYAVNWDGILPGSNYPLVSQYVAAIKAKSSLDLILKHPSNTLELNTQIQIPDISNWSKYGNADFTPSKNTIASDFSTDAALYSDFIDIPKGFYKVEARLNWDAKGEIINGYENAVHVSILGVRKLISIQNSKGKDRKITIYTSFSGEPSRIAFGLGGWAKGEGFVQLSSIKITRITLLN